jgi:hypothetical protein
MWAQATHSGYQKWMHMSWDMTSRVPGISRLEGREESSLGPLPGVDGNPLQGRTEPQDQASEACVQISVLGGPSAVLAPQSVL